MSAGRQLPKMAASYLVSTSAACRLFPGLYALALCMLVSCAATAQDSRAAAETASKQVPLTKIKPLLSDLDALFDKGDIKTYLSQFTPDHEGALAMLGRHLEQLLKLSGKTRTRKSAIIAGPMVFENRTVVRVRHTTSWPVEAGKTAGDAKKPYKHVEDTYLAVTNSLDGGIVPTFQIDMPPQVHCVTDAKLKCPPCNYEIGGVEGFLCVPLRRERGMALESASFYLIGTDVVCDVHVQVPSKPESAKAVAQKLAEAFADLEPSAQIGIPDAWAPPMHKKEPPAGMDSARLVVELPLDHEKAGGDVTIFHVVSFGGVQHVLLVRTTKASLKRHQKSVDQLFMSYMLLELDCRVAALATEPLRAHTGGVIDGSSYTNERFRVSLDGPKGWKVRNIVGGSMFRLRWSAPTSNSSMWLVGHQVPAGMPSWTKKTADRYLNHHRVKHGLAVDKTHAATDEAKWHTNADGALCRSIVFVKHTDQRLGSPRRRIVHVQLHKDLLVVADGFGATKADEETLRAAFGTLTRK